MASPGASQSSAARSWKRSPQLSIWCRAPIAARKTLKSAKLRPEFSMQPDGPNSGPPAMAMGAPTYRGPQPGSPAGVASCRRTADFQSAISLRLRLTQTSSSTNSRAETNLKSPLKSLDRRSAARALGEETMGRVYDALKRAESAPRHFTSSKSSVRRNGNPDNVSYFVPKNGHEHPWEGSPF